MADVERKLQGVDPISPLENYYGLKQHSYTIILVPLFSGGYGPRMEQKDGAFDVYIIIGPREAKAGLPDFGSAGNLERLAWHEFSHSFVNPITERSIEGINKYSSLYDPVSSWMKPQAYGNWETCVNEHLIRAVNGRLAYHQEYKEKGEKAAERALQDEIQSQRSKGFFYVEALCKRLELYEANRVRYQTFVDFYPELITLFKELSEAKLGEDFFSIPFTGTINGVCTEKNRWFSSSLPKRVIRLSKIKSMLMLRKFGTVFLKTPLF